MKLKATSPFRSFLQWYFSKNALPYWCVLAADCFIVFISTLLTYWMFYRTNELIEHRFSVLYTALLYILPSLLSTRFFHTYSGIIRYSSFIDLLKVGYANLCTAIMAGILSRILPHIAPNIFVGMTFMSIICIFSIATLQMWGIRILIKILYDVSATTLKTMPVLIYGAGAGGVGLAKNIQTQRPRKFLLRGFISHDAQEMKYNLMGVQVYPADEGLCKVIKSNHITAVLVSPLRVEEFREQQELQNLLIDAGCKIFMSQSVKEMPVKDGQINETPENEFQLHEVSVEDLLPRQQISVDMQHIGEQLSGKRILITGAAGSIGSEIVRQIAELKPEKMILIDQAETPSHDIRLMMSKQYPDVDACTIVATICDAERMDHIFKAYRPDYVFHAAAYKHVPMMEDNPSEAVHNNVWGTKVIADLSVKYGVKKFVMVSTDKAVNPTNVMGCSKRICEIYVQSLSRHQKTTQFVTTRFGNVLGSNGSVIPLFREQIKNGGPVTVTDERIVRFFMLIPEACKLVLEAGTRGNGGEIFVFDMGNPVKIADLARRMIQLSGVPNIEIVFTGLRAGEKLYEEVLSEMEGTKPSFHEKIRIATVREYDYEQVCRDIERLLQVARQFDNMNTVKVMKSIVPEFVSNNSVYEQLDK